MKQPEEQEAIAQLRATFSEYETNYHLVVQMINANKSPIEIDEAVIVSDAAALDAKDLLVASARRSGNETKAQAEEHEKEAIRFMQYGGSVLVVVFFSTIAALIFFLQRATLANTLTQKTEARLNALLDTSPDPMISVSQNGKIVRVNLMAVSLFGYTQKEFLGMNFDALVPERYRHKHAQHRDDFVLHPHRRMMGETDGVLVALTRDGREVSVETS